MGLEQLQALLDEARDFGETGTFSPLLCCYADDILTCWLAEVAAMIEQRIAELEAEGQQLV